ncbi:Proton-dependent oligopeptide transporter family, partial [Dillenia turbinata]
MWADILAMYALWMMMTYLTNVWKLDLTHAAAIINVFMGVVGILPIGTAFLVDTLLGNFWMLLLSSLSYSMVGFSLSCLLRSFQICLSSFGYRLEYCLLIVRSHGSQGLGFLSMSTPPVLSKATHTCSAYEPECIGNTQKILFYLSLALIAVGLAGHVTSLVPFMAEQTTLGEEEDEIDMEKEFPWLCAGSFAVILVPIIGAISLPYIHPWSVRFGIPAILTLVATLLFLSGSCSYYFVGPQGSSLPTIFRVLLASVSKLRHRCPQDANQLYEIRNADIYSVPHTCGLRCLDKAAIIVPSDLEHPERSRWRLCRVTEVEETKSMIRMIPMWMTFIICGIVISIGNTYFIEQANHMSRKVGHLKVPLPILLLFQDIAKTHFTKYFFAFIGIIGSSGSRKYAAPIGIATSMIFAVLCCITAAKVETRRLD